MFGGTEFEGSRPVYGHMNTGSGRNHDSASMYGDARFVLKGVRDRTTITGGDSLGAGHRPPKLSSVPYTDPKTFSYRAHGPGGDYTEAQIHGGVTMDNVHRVEIGLYEPLYWKGLAENGGGIINNPARYTAQAQEYADQARVAHDVAKDAGLPVSYTKEEHYTQMPMQDSDEELTYIPGGSAWAGRGPREGASPREAVSTVESRQRVPVSEQQFAKMFEAPDASA